MPRSVRSEVEFEVKRIADRRLADLERQFAAQADALAAENRKRLEHFLTVVSVLVALLGGILVWGVKSGLEASNRQAVQSEVARQITALDSQIEALLTARMATARADLEREIDERTTNNAILMLLTAEAVDPPYEGSDALVLDTMGTVATMFNEAVNQPHWPLVSRRLERMLDAYIRQGNGYMVHALYYRLDETVQNRLLAHPGVMISMSQAILTDTLREGAVPGRWRDLLGAIPVQNIPPGHPAETYRDLLTLVAEAIETEWSVQALAPGLNNFLGRHDARGVSATMVSVCATPHDPGHEDRLFVLAAALVDGLRDYADLDGEDLRNRICEEMTHSL